MKETKEKGTRIGTQKEATRLVSTHKHAQTRARGAHFLTPPFFFVFPFSFFFFFFFFFSFFLLFSAPQVPPPDSVANDRMHGLRVHCWVLVRAGA